MNIRQGMTYLENMLDDPYNAVDRQPLVLWRSYHEGGSTAFMVARPTKSFQANGRIVVLDIIGAHPNSCRYCHITDPMLQYDDWVVCRVSRGHDSTTYIPIGMGL